MAIRLFFKFKKTKYLFIAHVDTHVQWMHIIANLVHPHSFLIELGADRDLVKALKDINEPYEYNFPLALKIIKPQIIVMGNDWGQIGKEIIIQAKKEKISTVCIQEGAVNVGISPSFPLHHADYIFILGEVMRKYLHREGVILTGNPKFKIHDLVQYPTPPVIMVNCNFAYYLSGNEYALEREKWLKNIAEACEEVGINFFISQHPKDNTHLDPKWKVIKSNAKITQSQLESATILITQRSTMIYEAFCMGRQVIYYHFPEPWQETNMFAEDPNNALIIVKEDVALSNAIRKALTELENNKKNRVEFLKYHCNLYPDAKPAEEVIIQNLNEIILRRHE
jgi:hypothetical protein